ncbi:MAG: DUF192 domain-containing protein [Candidatus Thiodiazotropha lotti]|nr:DUF192 domain-containing protein [Candidatus Thiodiazotropha lotti]
MNYINMYYKSVEGKDRPETILKVRVANTFYTQLRGLLARKKLVSMEGLLLPGCSSIHTIGMHYALDIVFMDGKGRVIKTQACVKPFRAAVAKGASYTLELANGMIDRLGISENDGFTW